MARVTIAAGSQITADAGATIANQGGNAVDAALAATLVAMSTDLGVMAPGASGFIAVWPAAGEPVVIDAYADMPGAFSLPSVGQGTFDVRFDYGGPMSNRVGYGLGGHAGHLCGVGLASNQYGTLPWRHVVTPAIDWVERGFPLTGGAAEYLRYTHEAIFSWHPDSYRALHHDDGRLLQQGEIVHIPDLADSLAVDCRSGCRGFLHGGIGQRMAADIQANGGLLTAEDLAAYRAIPRHPLRVQFSDWQVATNPSPAIGGACLAAMLLLLDYQAQMQGACPSIEHLIESQRAVLAYRTQALDGLADTAEAITQMLQLARQGNCRGLAKSPSTIHISAVDSAGLACSISASAGYGSGVMIPGTGLWLNNSLGEVDLHPQGLEDLPPGTRLSSNMAPTLAQRSDGAKLAIGSPGASRITTAIAQVLLNIVHRKLGLADAIAYPRLHVEVIDQALRLAFEPGLSIPDLPEFSAYPFETASMYFGGVQAASWTPEAGLAAAADFRRAGGVAEGGSTAGATGDG
ncbi:gamma-glutamyltransferase [Halomicronema hongdechloris]|nr:gamma-glutamyltransferase [Halomicronema hongdechloris]